MGRRVGGNIVVDVRRRWPLTLHREEKQSIVDRWTGQEQAAARPLRWPQAAPGAATQPAHPTRQNHPLRFSWTSGRVIDLLISNPTTAFAAPFAAPCRRT
jgi:hypothetical protein